MAAQKSSTIVIGTGIIGASIAWHLAKAGHRVTIFGPAPGGVATPASFSWINASWGNPPHYVRLRMQAMAEWERLARDLPGLEYRRTGGLTFDLDDEDLMSYQREQSALGYRLDILDAAAIAALEPGLALKPSFALHALDEGFAEGELVVARLMADAIASGNLTHVETIVERLARTDEREIGAVVGGKTWAADHVVLAAGVATATLAGTVGVKVPVTAPPGLIVHSRPTDRMLDRLVIARELHMRQTLSGRIIAGSDFGGSEPGENPEETARALFAKVQAALVGGERLEMERFSIGHRPTPKDGLPIVGEAPNCPGLHLAVMHSGVTLAPIMGALLAREIIEGKRNETLAAFRPERFDRKS